MNPKNRAHAEDAEAMRLVVELGLSIGPQDGGVFVSRYESEPVFLERYDPGSGFEARIEATRRAIFRAADALGKK